MLFSELHIFKQVSAEFCASALANAMKGNIQLALTDLETATKFANQGVGRGEWLSTMVSLSIQYQINRTCLRIVEIRPEMTDQIRAFITSERRFLTPNFIKMFKSTFLDQISGCRVFDIPKMDSRTAPFPLSLLVKEVDSNENEYEGVIAKSGDYIPKSPAMRHYLREKLIVWKPFLTKLLDPKNAGYQPNFLDYAPISQVLTNSPAPFKKLAGDELLMGSDEEAHRNLLKPKLNDQASKIVWWGIGQHRKTGRFPPSLQGQNFSTDAFDSLGGIVYSSSVGGLILISKMLDDDGQPWFQMSFPVSFGRTTTTSRKQIDDYRKGKIDRKGTPL